MTWLKTGQLSMRTIAIGGLLYPIDRFLASSVSFHSVRARGQAETLKAIRRAIESDSGPTRLIGFSRGATFAIQLFEDYPQVVEVYAHSAGTLKCPVRRTRGRVQFFRTDGDRMGNVFKATGDLYSAYVKAGLLGVSIDDLPFERIAVPSNPTERLMNLRKHVFHNCLPHLPAEAIANVSDGRIGKGKE